MIYHNKRIITRTVKLTLLCLFLFLLININVHADSLKNEINIFIDAHPKITAARQQLSNANIDVKVAKDNYMPVLRVSSDIGDQSYSDSAVNIDSTMNNNRYIVEISQNVFRGFRDRSLQNQAMVKETIAIKKYENTRQEVLLEAINAYLDVLHYDQVQTVVEKKVELIQQYSELMNTAKESGLKTDVDVYEAQLSYQQSLEQQSDIQGKYLSALGNFESLYGYSAIVESMSTPVYDSKLIPSSLDESLDLAKNQSVLITLAQSNIDQALYEKDTVKSDYWPSLDIVGSASEENNKEGRKGRTQDNRIYLKIEWRYNLGHQNFKKVKSASGNIIKERYNYEAVIKDVSKKVRLAWQKHTSLKARLKIANDTLKIANNVYEARKDLKLKGKGGSIAIITAKAKLLDSTIARYNASFESLKSSYALAKEFGSIQQML